MARTYYVKAVLACNAPRRNTSKAAYNLNLSKKRGQAVADYLVKKGIDRSRLVVKGYGFDMPVVENNPKQVTVLTDV
jgi:outer membrane protein OmpA-like peptidoglycan-associated protein|tara:strand:- start:1459 stop:1689 length:231 start_codon:yes stop_codon:yes gene_type:complete